MPTVVKKSKKSKRPNTTPARGSYWTSGRLAAKKVRNLMKHNGLTRAQAMRYWLEVRGGRRMRGGIVGTLLTPKEQSDFYRKVS